MGWGLTRKQEQDKIEFEIPDDIKAKIEAGEKASAELTALQQKFEATNSEFSSFKEEFEVFKTTVAARQAQTAGQTNTDSTAEELDFFGDPEKAVKKVVGEGLTPMVNIIAEMRSDRIMSDLRQKYPDMSAPNVEKEFAKAIEKYGIGERANKALMENTFRVVRDKMREEGRLETEEYNNVMERSRQNGGFASSFYAEHKKPAKKFNAEEKAFLDRYDISEEEADNYLKAIS